MSQDEVRALHDAEHCIMCGACYSSCQVVGLNKGYIGPHALLKAYLRVMDPRDSAPRARLDDLDRGDGVYRCHTIFNCIEACPKGLNPTEAIETLRKLAMKRQAFEDARRERQQRLDEPIPGR
jgi:succinate dehydrogenase / fumarate reductase iron-sulfur subunit